ncbi:ABC transporter substrate-binding protein [Azohydromonas caseinilytica]|uniref:ABC transporter substrate-binding protein n=1 Tax=Azohydromonas caseinilytica TaxID=2728836 RepID=A0A848FIM8_9BURK|nr:ABC transporter substrate-binding protein [Azohydromonas caseinilytica]NML18060.1 ABC transporter substrate-binding protein [Azohydromonas caseinilytica]
MKVLYRFVGSVGVVAALASVGAAQAATVTISCASVGVDFENCKRHSAQWAAKTGHTVKIFTMPSSSTDILSLFRQMFAAKSSDLDVLNIDVVWPGVIKDHLLDLKPYSKGAEKSHFPAIVANNTVDGKLLAMPNMSDAGMLYYRKDLLQKYGLQPPATWEELGAAAKKIQDGERAAGAADFQGYVFQGKAYEGLSCNALEWISSFGGQIVDAGGKVTVNSPATVQAFKMAASWPGTIAPKGVLNYAEEDARGVFQNGKAAFMRNWPYAWSLGQGADSAVKGKVGVAPLPRGGGEGQHAAALGGWQWAVSKYSRNPEVAADLVMYLSSREIQKERAVKYSFNPTMPELYQDKDVLAANPFMAEMYEVMVNAVPRPSTVTGAKYPEVSQALWNTAHDVMSGKASAEDAVKRLEGRLNQIKRGKW